MPRLDEAWTRTWTGRPGPVLVEVPLDVLRAETKRVGLTFAQGHALLAIESDSALSVGDLAAVLRLSPSTTSRLPPGPWAPPIPPEPEPPLDPDLGQAA